MKNIFTGINNAEGKPLANRLRAISIILGCFIIVQLGLVLLWSHNDLNSDSKIAIEARVMGKNLGSYKNDQFPNGNYFISGMEGRLYWHPNNLTESILLNTFSKSGSTIDIIEVISFAIISLFFILTIKSISRPGALNKGITGKFYMLIMVVSLWGGVVDLVKSALAENYVNYITHGQFTANYIHGSIIHGNLVYLLLSLLVIFPQTALKLQQEQALTI